MSDFCNAYWALQDAAAEHGLTMDDLEAMAAPLPSCDICGEQIQPDEKFSDDGSEIAHTSCVSGWFGRNFGRESLS